MAGDEFQSTCHLSAGWPFPAEGSEPGGGKLALRCDLQARCRAGRMPPTPANLSQAGSTLLSTSCLLYQMVWGSTGALLGKQGALALGLALGRGADRCQVSVHTGSLSQHVGVFLSRMLSPGHGGDQPAPS